MNHLDIRKIKILQYRADKQDGHWLDDAIACWTRFFNRKTPPYSHSEICFSDGRCFSSTTRSRSGDKKKFIGTRFEDYKVVTRNKERWDIFCLYVTSRVELEMLLRARKIVGRKYYFTGIFLDFFMPLGLISYLLGRFLNRWYCSQAVNYVRTGRRTRVSPRRLYTWLKKDGWQKCNN